VDVDDPIEVLWVYLGQWDQTEPALLVEMRVCVPLRRSYHSSSGVR